MGSQTALRGQAVPFFDLRPSHSALKSEILDEIGRLIDVGAFTNGPQVGAFEAAFAQYTGAAECVGLASGLDALRLALLSAGIEPGDEVIVPAATFVASLEAVTQAGGRPTIVDISDADLCLDPEAAAAAAGEKTRFMMPVHLYGQMADMRAVGGLAGRQGLTVIADACQAHGAVRDSIGAGRGCLAGAFSFYPAKNLGAFGDAGAVVTDDSDLAARLRALREHGQRRKYEHTAEGFTARLDTIQALVLLKKLPLLDRWNDERRAVASQYFDELDGVGDLRLPPVPEGSRPVWHLFVVRTGDPSGLAEHLRLGGIATGRHYPEPVHLSMAYSWLGHRRGEFPVAEALAEQGISLPLFPGITASQVSLVAEAIRSYFSRG